MLVVDVEPAGRLKGFELTERGPILRRRARALLSRLPRSVGERELAVVRRELGWSESETEVEHVEDALGPGSALLLEVQSREVTEVFTGFGQLGVTAERVAGSAARDAARYTRANVPVDEHLADQLMLPPALAGSGLYRTQPLTAHAVTNAAVIRGFLDVPVASRELADGSVEVRVGRGAG